MVSKLLHVLAAGWLLTVAGKTSAYAQTQAAPPRHYAATRATGPIKLDANLDEATWQAAPAASQFTQRSPNPGVPERHRTEVRILYDDAALYVGAVMHDASPDSILKQLTPRDQFGNTDVFAVMLDTYHDRLNGYYFDVTASGVQLDARVSQLGEDFSWDAVWESKTATRGNTWVAEMRIPYSALRFANAPEQLWGLNFARIRQRDNQLFFWNEMNPAIDGKVTQWGDLHGVRDIKPPLRLSFTPYVSAYLNDNPLHTPGTPRTTRTINGGADVKWGINESFTLDATLVPDFGQVQSDNQVLNLSPFEVQFNENRPFFTEGTELFNKGGLFYSRRVGGQPLGYYEAEGQLREGEYLLRNPAETRLLNASKLSGRTSKGLGVGVFNALSPAVYATARTESTGQEREIMTQPLSNYNIVVLDQSLKHNSYVSLVNTNVTRAGQTYDANVTGGLFRFANKANAYAVRGNLTYSRRRGLGFNSEAAVREPDGYNSFLEVSKISGNFTWTAANTIYSHTFNSNDLGLLFNNNSITNSLDFLYSRFKPTGPVNNYFIYWGLGQSSLYRPTRYQRLNAYLSFVTTFTRSFLKVNLDTDYTTAANDFFEPRVQPLGTYSLRLPANSAAFLTLATDARKRLQLETFIGARVYAREALRPRRWGGSFVFTPRFRFNDKLTVQHSFEYQPRFNQVGYPGRFVAGNPVDEPFARRGDVLLGCRDVLSFINTLSGSYILTNRMSLTVRARHYTSNLHYKSFTRLLPAGREEPVEYARNRDTNFNAFNVDAVFSWWFAPGSQVSFVWKNAAISNLQGEAATPQYFDNLTASINSPHTNSVSVKLLYFLDYLRVRQLAQSR